MTLKGSSSSRCTTTRLTLKSFSSTNRNSQLQSCNVKLSVRNNFTTFQSRGGDEAQRRRPATHPQRMPTKDRHSERLPFHSKFTRPQAKRPQHMWSTSDGGPFVKDPLLIEITIADTITIVRRIPGSPSVPVAVSWARPYAYLQKICILCSSRYVFSVALVLPLIINSILLQGHRETDRFFLQFQECIFRNPTVAVPLPPHGVLLPPEI